MDTFIVLIFVTSPGSPSPTQEASAYPTMAIRASYFLLDEFTPTIRRVSYDIDREVRALQGSAMPHADWIARILKSATFVMP
jgi:hypothetical protein